LTARSGISGARRLLYSRVIAVLCGGQARAGQRGGRVHDAGDGGFGVESVQVGEAEERLGADHHCERVLELGRSGGVGADGVVGERGERVVDQAETQAGARGGLGGAHDGCCDHRAHHALAGQDVAQQELGRRGDPLDRVGGVCDRGERLGRGGQLAGDRLAQQAG
jgi:hypothetical protein